MDAKIGGIVRAGTELQTDLLDALIREVVGSGSVPAIRDLAEKILSDEINTQLTKTGMITFAKEVAKEGVLPDEVFTSIADFLLGALKSHVSPLDEADYILRDALFNHHVSCEEYTTAAQYLSGANLDSTARVFSDHEKADICIKCAEAVLEDDEAIDAEIYMNKASAVINNAADDYALQLRYRVTYARVLDANRKFVEAAQRYYELSTTTNVNVVEKDLLELLGKAVTCAVLGKTGQPRTRVLALLYQDARLGSLDTQLEGRYASHGVVLRRMFREERLRKEELAAFQACLMPHQKATTQEGYTILEKAVIEHNMMAASKIYDNIRIIELAKIVELDPYKAEKVAATMITEGRLRAVIDQAEGFIDFLQATDEGDDANGRGGSGDIAGATVASVGDPLGDWNESIRALCTDVTDFVDRAEQVFAEHLISSGNE